MANIIFRGSLIALLAMAGYLIFANKPPPLPQLPLDKCWGLQSLRTKVDNRIRPFKIQFDKPLIQDLKQRIRSARPFTPPLEGVGFEYGVNTQEIKGWLQYWAENYNFTQREMFLNEFKSYKTYIQGLDIHFLHIKPELSKHLEVVPLLMHHGWPGSVREFYEAIPLLTAVKDSQDFAVELIVPSLPGFGFSDAAKRPGLGPAESAIVLRNLMHRLGHKKYYIQGGDFGAITGSYIATLFPDEVLGLHLNMALSPTITALALTFVGSVWPSMIMGDTAAHRMYPLTGLVTYALEETGYLHIQSTKPDTVGVALSDSPAGLLAYILEKFSTGTDRNDRSRTDGGLSKHFTKDQLLDNLMFYWTTNSITTSMRLYAETFNRKHFGYKLDDIPTPVPTWIIQAKHEIAYQPPLIQKLKYPNLLHETVLDGGGHFLAFQLPEVFAQDVLKSIDTFRKWHIENRNT